MTRFLTFAALALASLASAAQAQEPPKPNLTIEQRTALRCSVAFALVAEGQARGDAAMAAYPVLGERGREFFVRTSARIMDETGMSRDAVAGLLGAEVESLREEGALDRVMSPCMLLLDASGL